MKNERRRKFLTAGEQWFVCLDGEGLLRRSKRSWFTFEIWIVGWRIDLLRHSPFSLHFVTALPLTVPCDVPPTIYKLLAVD
jgi:hypothetical protein